MIYTLNDDFLYTLSSYLNISISEFKNIFIYNHIIDDYTSRIETKNGNYIYESLGQGYSDIYKLED